jgi:hypothetical protein
MRIKCEALLTTQYWFYQVKYLIKQRILDTNAGKQLSQAAGDVSLTLVLKK